MTDHELEELKAGPDARKAADDLCHALMDKGHVPILTTGAKALIKAHFAAQTDPKTLTLVAILSALWTDRMSLMDAANNPSISDAEVRLLCLALALPPTQEDMAWARAQMIGEA